MNWASRPRTNERTESFPTEWALTSNEPTNEERRFPPATEVSSQSESTPIGLEPLPDSSAA